MKQLLTKLKSSTRTLGYRTTVSTRGTSSSTQKPSTVDADDSTSSTTTRQPNPQKTHGRLEALPAEIRRHLLTVLDLPQLKAIVHASPVFHQQYLYDRRHILHRSLEATLGSVLVDAYAVHVCGAHSKEAVAELFEVLDSQKTPTDELDLAELERMANFYFRHVAPVVEIFSLQAMGEFSRRAEEAGVVDRACIQKAPSLSVTETLRFTRAVYRFQILCQVAVHLEGKHMVRSIDDQRGRIERLLNLNQPWEIETLLSFYEFVERHYDSVFKRIHDDVHPDNPRFDDQGRPPTPIGAFDLGPLVDLEPMLEGTILHGLPLLRQVLVDIKDQEALVQTMQKHIDYSYLPLNQMEGMFGADHQLERREKYPSAQDRLHAARDPLPFRGDGDVDAPPLAWTTLWGDTYSNMYGYHTADGPRDWGYVFWDSKRFKELGGKELLSRWRVKTWGEHDPRDEVWVGA